MAKKFPLHPKHPERICWGCDKYCSLDSLRCGNGSSRTPHPAELLGDDWYLHGDWELDLELPADAAPMTANDSSEEQSNSLLAQRNNRDAPAGAQSQDPNPRGDQEHDLAAKAPDLRS